MSFAILNPHNHKTLNDLAQRLKAPSVSCLDEHYDGWLVFHKQILKIQLSLPPTNPFVYVDFTQGRLNHMRKFTLSKNQNFSKAIGICHGYKHILDLTAGLGKDAFFLACLGCKVIAIEKSPWVFSLLQDAHKRGLAHSKDKELTNILSHHLKFICQDSFVYLDQLSSFEHPEVIFIDPMFFI